MDFAGINDPRIIRVQRQQSDRAIPAARGGDVAGAVGLDEKSRVERRAVQLIELPRPADVLGEIDPVS